MKRKILFLTGTRADFGKLKSLIAAVEQDDAFESAIFATGMHLDPRYGLTVDEVLNAGFGNIHTFQNQTNGDPMEVVLANTVIGLSRYVARRPPDMIVVHGDRVEPLAGAIVGALRNIFVAHIEGGEVSGAIDETIRHAISKMAHLHFVANKTAAARLLHLGEASESVYIIGSPDIDIMLSDRLPDIDSLRRRYEIFFEEYAVVLFHPVTTESERQAERAERFTQALIASGRNFVVIYPNNDMGSEVILDAYHAIEGHPRFRILPSMRFEYFLTLLKNASCIVGNSSAGIREAPVFGVPKVNVGNRQCNRFQYESIRNVSHEAREIQAAIEHAWVQERLPQCRHFGEGNSAQRFLAALHEDSLWRRSLQKLFCDYGNFLSEILRAI